MIAYHIVKILKKINNSFFEFPSIGTVNFKVESVVSFKKFADAIYFGRPYEHID